MGDLLQIIRNVAGVIPDFEILFYVISWFMGVLFAVLGLRGFAKWHADGRSAGDWTQPFWMLVIGVLFVGIPSLMGSLTVSIFGTGSDPDPSSIFSYAEVTLGVMQDGAAAREIIESIVIIVRFVGLIAVMRGLYLLQQASKGHGQSTFGPGFTFLIAGVLAFNFNMFVGVMESLILAPPS